MVMWNFSWEPLSLGHHTSNFNDIRHCGSEDKTFLIYHVISKDPMFKRLCDLIDKSPSTLPSLMAISLVVAEI